MLNIYFGDMEGAIYDTAAYFDHRYLGDWLKDELSQRILKSIDRATVLSEGALNSKALGVIPVTAMSGGSKTLLLIQHEPNKVFNASNCGDNCARWILEIARRKKEDVTINLLHMMDFGEKPFEIRIVNNGQIVRNMREYVLTVGFFLSGDIKA